MIRRWTRAEIIQDLAEWLDSHAEAFREGELDNIAMWEKLVDIHTKLKASLTAAKENSK